MIDVNFIYALTESSNYQTTCFCKLITQHSAPQIKCRTKKKFGNTSYIIVSSFILGLGNSAADIATDASYVAKQVIIFSVLQLPI